MHQLFATQIQSEYRNRLLPTPRIYFSVGNGWASLLRRCCNIIDRMRNMSPDRGSVVDLRAVRAEDDHGRPELALDIQFGDPRARDSETFPSLTGMLRMGRVQRRAELESKRVCSKCGADDAWVVWAERGMCAGAALCRECLDTGHNGQDAAPRWRWATAEEVDALMRST